MTASTTGRRVQLRLPRPAAWAVRRATTVRLLALGCAAVYAAALAPPWLRSGLGAPLGAGDLPLEVPGFGRPFGATWTAVVVVLVVAHVVVALVPARFQAPAARTGAALSVTALGGFLLLGVLTDHALGQRLVADQAALDTVRRIVGYRIPRPSVSTLGPLELPSGAAALASALRPGFFLALVAAVVSGVLWARTRRRTVRARVAGPALWLPRAVVTALALLVAVAAVEGSRASWSADRAATELAGGDLGAARASADAALGRNATLGADPVLARVRGEVAAATATGPVAQQLFGQSLLAQDAGRYDDALDLAVQAADAGSWTQSHADDVCRQATARAASAAGIDAVRSLVPVSRRCDLTLLQLASSELAAGRYDLVRVDAAELVRQTPDEDVRSAALTMLAQARLGAGDLIGGRAVLQEALDADPHDVNVVARALASGLYSAARR